MKKTVFRCIFSAIFIAAFAAVAGASGFDPEVYTVARLESLDGLTYDGDSDVYRFPGFIRVELENIAFEASGLVYYAESGKAEAFGPVKVSRRPGGEDAQKEQEGPGFFRLEGKSLSYDLKADRGILKGARIAYRPGPEGREVEANFGEIAIEGKARSLFIQEVSGFQIGDYTLEASEVRIDLEARSIQTDRPFRLAGEESVFEGEGLWFDLDEETGALRNFSGSYRGIHVRAESVEAEPGALRMHDARASVCELDGVPDFEVKSRTMVIEPKKALTFEKAAFYLRNWKVFSKGKFRRGLSGGEAPAESSPDGFTPIRYRQPEFGIVSYHGLQMLNGTWVGYKQKTRLDFQLDAYQEVGGLPEGIVTRRAGRGAWTFKYGRERRENMGYFLQSVPSIVTHTPQLGYAAEGMDVLGGRATLSAYAEAGRMRETFFAKPRNRLQLRVAAQAPVGRLAGGRINIASEGRLQEYQFGQRYRLWIQGANWLKSDGDRTWTYLAYHTVFDEGSTPFLLDAVDPTDKAIFSVSRPVDERYSLSVFGQFNIDHDEFDELEYFLTRRFKCVEVSVSWKSIRQELNGGFRILGLDF